MRSMYAMLILCSLASWYLGATTALIIPFTHPLYPLVSALARLLTDAAAIR